MHADAQRTRQVLLNLLGNAVKYNVECGSVICSVEPAEQIGRVRLVVRDTGVGLHDDDLARIFEPFERLDADSSVPGTGLGLAVAKQVAEAMEGQLGARAEAGGSTFWLELPLSQ